MSIFGPCLCKNLANPPFTRICRDLRALSRKFLWQKFCYSESFRFCWLCPGIENIKIIAHLNSINSLCSNFNINVIQFCNILKHRKNWECCPVSQLIVRYQRLSWIQVLNCQNCYQCLKCHKSPGLPFQFSNFQKLSQLSKLSLIIVIENCHKKLSSKIVIKNCHQKLPSKIVIKNCHHKLS